jgi:DNA-binding transcriptional MerR regulator
MVSSLYMIYNFVFKCSTKGGRFKQMDFWKISDFAKEVGKHQNTIDGWFKQLEEKYLHYVNRNEYGEKIYDELDLEIALFIRQKRGDRWSLDGIFAELPNRFDLRPALYDQTTNAPQNIDITLMRKEFENVAREIAAGQAKEMKQLIEEATTVQVSQIKQQYEDILRRLPQYKSKNEERTERITEMITRRRIESNLEREALNIWSTKPESERLIRVGFLRKEEDRDKKERFVREYINEYYEARIKEEFEIE